MIMSTARSASSLVLQMNTPLPAASPSALTTIGSLVFAASVFDVDIGLAGVIEDLAQRGGDAVFQHQPLGEDLAAFHLGGFLVRAEYLKPAPLNSSARPAISGDSGPTT